MPTLGQDSGSGKYQRALSPTHLTCRISGAAPVAACVPVGSTLCFGVCVCTRVASTGAQVLAEELSLPL